MYMDKHPYSPSHQDVQFVTTGSHTHIKVWKGGKEFLCMDIQAMQIYENFSGEKKEEKN